MNDKKLQDSMEFLWQHDIIVGESPTLNIRPIPISSIPNQVYIKGIGKDTKSTINCQPSQVLGLFCDEIALSSIAKFIELIRKLKIQVCYLSQFITLQLGSQKNSFTSQLLLSLPQVIFLKMPFQPSKQIIKLNHLLYLSVQHVSDQAAQYISQLIQLKLLSLIHSSLSFKGTDSLTKNLKNLLCFEIFANKLQIQPQLCDTLSNRIPLIEQFKLSCTFEYSIKIQHIKGLLHLRHLKKLTLSHLLETDRLIISISRVKSLQSLTIHNSIIGIIGYTKLIRNAQNLRTLSFLNCIFAGDICNWKYEQKIQRILGTKRKIKVKNIFAGTIFNCQFIRTNS